FVRIVAQFAAVAQVVFADIGILIGRLAPEPTRYGDVAIVTDVTTALMERHDGHNFQPSVDDGTENLVVVGPVELVVACGFHFAPPNIDRDAVKAIASGFTELPLKVVPLALIG